MYRIPDRPSSLSPSNNISSSLSMQPDRSGACQPFMCGQGQRSIKHPQESADLGMSRNKRCSCLAALCGLDNQAAMCIRPKCWCTFVYLSCMWLCYEACMRHPTCIPRCYHECMSFATTADVSLTQVQASARACVVSCSALTCARYGL